MDGGVAQQKHIQTYLRGRVGDFASLCKYVYKHCTRVMTPDFPIVMGSSRVGTGPKA